MIASMDRIQTPIAARGVYRIVVDVEQETAMRGWRIAYKRTGFHAIVALCQMLQKQDADYSVNWDTPETGVLILFAIPKRKPVTKRTATKRIRKPKTPAQEIPAVETCQKHIKACMDTLRRCAKQRRQALIPWPRTHVTAHLGHSWAAHRHQQQRHGHALRQWFAQGAKLDYKYLDKVFGKRVRRESELPAHWTYEKYIIGMARGSAGFYDMHKAYNHWPDVATIRENIAELETWREFVKLNQ